MDKAIRSTSYGQGHSFSVIDTLGIAWSELMVKRAIKETGKRNISALDLGCGYHARMLTSLTSLIASGVGVDVAVRPDVHAIKKIKIYEGLIEDVIPRFPDNTFDIVLLISVLEHLDNSAQIVAGCYRVLKEGGTLLINVPTWRGKFFLELSAYTLHLSPASEMDDHKAYYDKKDLWPVLAKAGFQAGKIRMGYYKFGLNLFCVCKK